MSSQNPDFKGATAEDLARALRLPPRRNRRASSAGRPTPSENGAASTPDQGSAEGLLANSRLRDLPGFGPEHEEALLEDSHRAKAEVDQILEEQSQVRRRRWSQNPN